MCLHDDIYMCWDEILHQASESACAYYNSNYDSFPDEYVDFLRSYFIAQIDAFEFGDKVTLTSLSSVYTKEYRERAGWCGRWRRRISAPPSGTSSCCWRRGWSRRTFARGKLIALSLDGEEHSGFSRSSKFTQFLVKCKPSFKLGIKYRPSKTLKSVFFQFLIFSSGVCNLPSTHNILKVYSVHCLYILYIKYILFTVCNLRMYACILMI